MERIKIYAFADEACKDMDGQIRAMCRNGLQGLEIRGVDGTNVSKITLEKAREVRGKLDDAGLVTWSVGSPIGKINIDGDFEAHMQTLHHTLEVANILGTDKLRIFSFHIPKEKDPWQYQSLVIDRLGSMLELAKANGITLCHENEKRIFGDTADRCRVLHTALPELKAVFDPANFVQCGEDTLRAWSMLKPYVHYLHIKDACSDGSVVPSGKGEGNVASVVLDYLASGGRCMTVEPHLTVFDGLKALEESGDTSVVGKQYTYPSADAAFDAACDALKSILEES